MCPWLVDAVRSGLGEVEARGAVDSGGGDGEEWATSGATLGSCNRLQRRPLFLARRNRAREEEAGASLGGKELLLDQFSECCRVRPAGEEGEAALE